LDNFLTTSGQFFDNLLISFDNFLRSFGQHFYNFFGNFLTIFD
jgi:hypothetical protein